MSDMGWTKHEGAQEKAEFGACYDAAEKSGHTKEEADNCDSGSLGCKNCPFKPAKPVKKCPNCGEELDQLNLSKQIEGTYHFGREDPWEWDGQGEPIVYTCPLCHTEIDDETLKDWDVI